VCTKYLLDIYVFITVPVAKIRLLDNGTLESDTVLCDKVCQWLVAGRWFSPGTPISSTNKTDRHDITEQLLGVVEHKSHVLNLGDK
jgi:hypothetical protein